MDWSVKVKAISILNLADPESLVILALQRRTDTVPKARCRRRTADGTKPRHTVQVQCTCMHSIHCAVHTAHVWCTCTVCTMHLRMCSVHCIVYCTCTAHVQCWPKMSHKWLILGPIWSPFGFQIDPESGVRTNFWIILGPKWRVMMTPKWVIYVEIRWARFWPKNGPKIGPDPDSVYILGHFWRSIFGSKWWRASILSHFEDPKIGSSKWLKWVK